MRTLHEKKIVDPRRSHHFQRTYSPVLRSAVWEADNLVRTYSSGCPCYASTACPWDEPSNAQAFPESGVCRRFLSAYHYTANESQCIPYVDGVPPVVNQRALKRTTTRVSEWVSQIEWRYVWLTKVRVIPCDLLCQTLSVNDFLPTSTVNAHIRFAYGQSS